MVAETCPMPVFLIREAEIALQGPASHLSHMLRTDAVL